MRIIRMMMTMAVDVAAPTARHRSSPPAPSPIPAARARRLLHGRAARFARAEACAHVRVRGPPALLVPGLHVRRVISRATPPEKYAERGRRRRRPETARPAPPGTSTCAAPRREPPRRVRLEVHDADHPHHPDGTTSAPPPSSPRSCERRRSSGRGVQAGAAGRRALVLINAVLAAEDHRFFEHGGVDAPGRAARRLDEPAAGRVMQGGCTITQQLVKNRLLGPTHLLAQAQRGVAGHAGRVALFPRSRSSRRTSTRSTSASAAAWPSAAWAPPPARTSARRSTSSPWPRPRSWPA